MCYFTFKFMNRPPTLKDLAGEAGVSISTVSRALNHHPSIPKATQKRIEKVASTMRYRPDARLSQLMSYLRKDKPTRPTNNLAWLDTWSKPDELKQPWNKDYIQGARERSKQMGYVLDEIGAQELRGSPKRINTVLQNRGVEGLMLPQFWDDHPIAKALDWNAFSVVFLDEYSPDLPGSRVSSHYAANILLAMQKLKNLGYRRPAVWISDFMDHNVLHAYTAYVPWAHKQWFSGPHLPVPRIVEATDENTALSAFLKKHRPDVLIVQSNTVMPLLNRHGFRVPEDIGVIHMNLADDVTGWAGIDQRHKDIGIAAVDTLVAQLRRYELGISRDGKHIFIPGIWKDGFTVRPCKR